MGSAMGYKERKKRESERGMIMGVRQKLIERGINVGIEGIIVGDIKQEKERWRIVEVYVKG